MVTKIMVPVHEALQWKLDRAQTLYKALCNYAALEVSGDIISYEIYVEDTEFIVEMEMGENADIQGAD